MKQILIISMALLLAGCESITHRATGRAPDQTYLLERALYDRQEITDCIIAGLDEVGRGLYSWSGVIGKNLTHHSIKTDDNTYEIHYRESPMWFGGDPTYYVKLSEVDNLLIIERYSGALVNIKWTRDSIQTCI